MTGNANEPPRDIVVSNSGPLIALSTVGRLDLLRDLFGQIYIPQAVYTEVVIYGAGELGAQEVGQAGWIKTMPVRDRLAVDILREGLDQGESEAIVLAQELKANYVLIDEAMARRKVRRIGLRMTGTLR